MISGTQSGPIAAGRLNRDDLFRPETRTLLKSGRGASAAVYLVSVGTDQWVLKDFSETTWLYRHTLGWLFVRREWGAIRRLQGLEGIPADPFLVKPFAMGYRFTAGETLSSLRSRKISPGGEFFLRLEHLVGELHSRGYAHLDLRNGKNILLSAENRPHLLDFASGLCISYFPPFLRRFFERIDFSGVYKWWIRTAPDSIDTQRRVLLRDINRKRRRYWLFNFPKCQNRLRE